MREFDSLSISWEFVEYEESAVVLLLAPYEATVCRGKGTSAGPGALINSFLDLELYDVDLRYCPSDVGIALMGLNLRGLKPPEAVLAVRDKAALILGDGKFPVLVGGEHTLSVGMVEALSGYYGDLSVLQLDAHADLREEYGGEKYNHACVSSLIREYVDCVQVGIRSMSSKEAQLIREGGYKIFYSSDIHDNNSWFNKALDGLTDDVYLSLDLDVLDSSIMPSVGTPEPGGLGWHQVVDLIGLLCEKKNVVGFDIMELSPIKGLHAPDYLAASLLYKIIGLRYLGGLG